MNLFFRTYWKKLLGLLFLFAIASRTTALLSALDYDEIWTLTYFSGKDIGAIFTELSLPNNQCLNSLCVKLLVNAGLPLWGVRLHSFAAGVLSVMLMAVLGTRLGGSRRAGFWSGVFLLCSAPAAVYSQLARGYELQLFFLLLCACGMTLVHTRRFRYRGAAAILAGGAGSVLTLPTSILFLGALLLGGLLIRPKAPGKLMLGLLAAGALFCAFWYGINLRQFQAGQQFGTVISTPGEMMRFAFVTLDKLIPLEWCFLLVPGVLLARRRLGAAVLCGTAFVLLSAFVTRGGPPRVYLPLVAGAALLCGTGIDRICRRLSPRTAGPAVLGALLLAGSGFYRETPKWLPPDWYGLFDRGARQESGTLVIYSATGGFPVMWNNQPRSLEDNAARIAGAEKLTRLLAFTGNGLLNGVDEKFSEKHIPLSVEGVPREGGFLYALERVKVPREGDEVIVITCEEDKSVDREFQERLFGAGEFLRLNIFFEQENAAGKISVIRGGRIGGGGKIDWKNLPDTVKVFRIIQLRKEEI